MHTHTCTGMHTCTHKNMNSSDKDSLVSFTMGWNHDIFSSTKKINLSLILFVFPHIHTHMNTHISVKETWKFGLRPKLQLSIYYRMRPIRLQNLNNTFFAQHSTKIDEFKLLLFYYSESHCNKVQGPKKRSP